MKTRDLLALSPLLRCLPYGQVVVTLTQLAIDALEGTEQEIALAKARGLAAGLAAKRSSDAEEARRNRDSAFAAGMAASRASKAPREGK